MNREIERLLETNQELENIFEYSFEGILVTDADANIIRVNNVSASFMQLTKEEILRTNVKVLEEKGIFSPSAVLRVLKVGHPVEMIQRAIGGRYVYVRAKPVYDTNGKLNRVISFTRDLTELMMLKKQLEETEDELNQYKRDLHEQMSIEGIISNSERMKAVLHMVRKVAAVNSHVLLLGETGVGKSIIAKAIHQLSEREKEPFYVVNCAALPESLIEVELFGYEGGMFTGAERGGKKGLFEIANGGTLFLDEIGELPIHLQAKLLHVLQEKQFRPVGGTEQLDINVRMITATNRDLKEMVDKGLFREDLYYRLNIFPITIPVLRERREDIIPLAHYFLHQHNTAYNKQVRLSPKVLETFLSYGWEGNVRELQNLIERLVVMADHSVIGMIDLPEHICASSSVKNNTTLKEILAEVEKSIILEVYEKDPSSYKVAEKLGISQTAATRKIKKYVHGK
ncbi:AAA domain-containing protein [Bacillus aerolatus]|uniref:HTH-type transcriptional regulatory protein TyrR n=1 Tax=Bacillus aerolatus TaxID=2653354 RepID=A0A6I1FM15_9BACI|nr:sigma 54-interacting transcriptional regulator [Bacillus aerolatus]KAB7707351.1 AAA domain-containing protein [Bacillus aerolatus]